MYIVGISIGRKETTASLVNTSNIIGNEIPCQDLYIGKDSTIKPTLLAETKEGKFYIPSSAYDFRNAVNVWRNFIAPLDTISQENRTVFRTFIKKIYALIFSNPDNPFTREKYQVYLNIEIYGWTAFQIYKLEEFLRNECGVSFTLLVPTSKALASLIRRDIGGGIRTKKEISGIVIYTDSTLYLVYLDQVKNTIMEQVFSLGANIIDGILFDYLLSENPQNGEYITLLKEVYPESKVTENVLERINRWKHEMEENRRSPQDCFFLPEINLVDLFYNRSFRGLYLEASNTATLSYNDYKQIISGYVVKLYDAFRDFKHYCNSELPSFVYLTGSASRFSFIYEIIENVYNVSKGESLVCDLCPEMAVSRGTASYGYLSSLVSTK